VCTPALIQIWLAERLVPPIGRLSILNPKPDGKYHMVKAARATERGFVASARGAVRRVAGLAYPFYPSQPLARSVLRNL
jgi:hypothetical protein